MYGWERFFNKKISEARKKEIVIMIKGLYLKFAVILIAILTSKLTFLILILSYIWMGYTTSTEIIFYVLTLFNDLKVVFGYTIPLNTSRAAEFRAALIRLNRLLNTEEIKKICDTEYEKASIELEGMTVRIGNKDILRNISLKIDIPELILVTGTVGAGKSSLLKAILQEYDYEGNVKLVGTISYASQEPWLFPSTIKDNILFGQKYVKERYQEVITVCALEYDFSLLELGDETIVADRGLNLSKGQQARINLARAIYKKSDIYLLDDSLTALDVRIQNFIFNECITKFLNGKICFLVTQNTEYMSKAGKVIVLENGQICLTQNSMNDKTRSETLNANVHSNLDSNEIASDEQKNENKIYREAKKLGKVELKVYKKYFYFGGGIFLFCSIMTLYLLSQFLESYSDQLLTDWVDVQQEVLSFSKESTGNQTGLENKISEKDAMLNWYTMITIITSAMGLAKFYILLRFCRNASINIHQVMSTRVVNSIMAFFDTHFIGNILNRFSYDLYNIDENLPFIFPDMVATIVFCAGAMGLLIKVNWIFLLPSGVFVTSLLLTRSGYIPSGRSLKRLEAATRSPLVGHINSSLEGLATIRAFKAQKILKDQFDTNQDLYSSAYFTLVCTMTGFEFFMDILCALFSTSVVMRFVLFEHDISAGNVGLALTQVFMLTENVQWGIRQWADVENHMTSVERVLEYTDIKKEATLGKEMEEWPKGGSVTFDNVTLSYENTTRPILKNISFHVDSGQKIGIVGRTGAGKSSIISALFRLYEFQGNILIDGVPTKELVLSFLRKTIAIIPQDPVLFTDTIRNNIDPNHLYTDEEIWKVIERVRIKHLIPSLDQAVTEGGGSFSVGQKQLICLARAAIGKHKIIILDEATANMDSVTDEMLHEVINEIFADCTVLMIAHRLRSILDCDKVMVLEKGELIEFDTPSNLLDNSSSLFCNMCKELTVNK